MRLIITGTPGTGKTSVAEILSKRLGWKVIHDKDLAKRRVVDLRSFRASAYNVLRRMENVIAEGHLFCEVKLPADAVVVLRTRPDVLAERLRKRGYPEEKIWENVEAEALDYCLLRAEEKYGSVNQIDTTERTVEETARLVERVVSGKHIYEAVDWTDAFMQMLLNRRRSR